MSAHTHEWSALQVQAPRCPLPHLFSVQGVTGGQRAQLRAITPVGPLGGRDMSVSRRIVAVVSTALGIVVGESLWAGWL